MRRDHWVIVAALCAALAVGCGDDGGGDGSGTSTNNATTSTNAGTTSTNSGTASTNSGSTGTNSGTTASGAFADTKSKAPDAELAMPGLQHPVYVSFDQEGIPHILAESWEDAFMAQGFVHARDRLPQMDLFRRISNGTLGRVAGALDASVVDDDVFQRVIGFRRTAERIYADMDEGSLSKRALEAYCLGVNAYIDRVKAGEEEIVADAQTLVRPSTLDAWTPLDSLVIVRLQQFNLSYDPNTELRLTRGRSVVPEVFPPDTDDTDLALRSGLLQDLIRFAPADPTSQIPGFFDTSKPSNGATPRPDRPELSPQSWKAPSPKALAAAMDFDAAPRSSLYRTGLTRTGASNSWLVAGSKTASGHAMLANDPHLLLSSPALFHQVHLVVEPKDAATEGPALNAFGYNFPGLPGVLIGHNADVAWGLTTANYDFTDTFREELVWEDGAEWPKVRHNGQEVELEIIEETIEIGGFGDIEERTIQIPIVPHHGPLLLPIVDGELLKPEGDEAISVAWPGFQPSNEVEAIMRWMVAEDLDGVREGLDEWIIGTQNLVFATRSGDIYSTSKSWIPNRPAAALDWDPVTNPDGFAPWWTLPGTGEFDWQGPLPEAQIPSALNPASGFIVTANNDQAGVTNDNNPLNESTYVGYDYDLGYRGGRITRMLTGESGDWPSDHAYTLEDLGKIQTDTHSNFGEALTPDLLAELDRMLEELDAPGTYPGLGEALAGVDKARLETLKGVLEAWSFEADNGLLGDVTPERINDSAATSLFNVWTTILYFEAFGDELERTGSIGVGSQMRSKGLLWVVQHADETATLDPETGESAMWDDLDTPDARESRVVIFARALVAADARLETLFESSDPSAWRWGRLHNRTFSSLIPALGGRSPFTVPREDEEYPDGFPRSGDNYNVDACNGGNSSFDYACGGGAVVRWVIDMNPEGIESFNALPGGQAMDPASPWFRNGLDYWLNDTRYKVAFEPDEVAEGHLESVRFTP